MVMPAILATAYASLVGSSGPVCRCIFLDRLLGVLGIDAGAPEEHHLLHARTMRAVDHTVLDEQIVADEVCGLGVVGHDPADLAPRRGRRATGRSRSKNSTHAGRIGQVQLTSASDEQIVEAERARAGARSPNRRGHRGPRRRLCCSRACSMSERGRDVSGLRESPLPRARVGFGGAQVSIHHHASPVRRRTRSDSSQAGSAPSEASPSRTSTSVGRL